MVNSGFRSYRLAVGVYRGCVALRCAAHLREQLLKASSSVALNLAEGSGKPSPAEKARYYGIALGSLREVQAILDLAVAPAELVGQADELGGHVYRLCHPRG